MGIFPYMFGENSILDLYIYDRLVDIGVKKTVLEDGSRTFGTVKIFSGLHKKSFASPFASLATNTYSLTRRGEK